MPSNFHVDANLISTPFSSAANTSGARNEERRLERIYGGAPRPKQDGYARMLANAAIWEEHKTLQVQNRAAFGTSASSSKLLFAGRQFTLPSVRQQDFIDVHSYGNIDQHFGGLGLTSHMVKWFMDNSAERVYHVFRATEYNEKLAKKSFGGMFKRKTEPAKPVEIMQQHDFDAIFNRKLAEVRVPARVAVVDGKYVMQHPSSESGDAQAEMRAWAAAANWGEIPERPWQDTMIQLPPVPTRK